MDTIRQTLKKLWKPKKEEKTTALYKTHLSKAERRGKTPEEIKQARMSTCLNNNLSKRAEKLPPRAQRNTLFTGGQIVGDGGGFQGTIKEDL